MKWVRQRCQDAPANTVAIASLSPRWASEVTSCTPLSPRDTSERRNWSQKAPSSLVPTSMPTTSRLPSPLTAVATTTLIRLRRTPCLPHLLGQRVEPEVGVGTAIQRPA